MSALFECYDESGHLQLTTEAATYYVSNSFSQNTTSMGGGGYGQLDITGITATDLVAFRCTNGINLSGYKTGPTTYRIISQTAVCTIQVKILSLVSNLSASSDSFGLQLFSPTGELQFTAARQMSFFLGSVSVYGEYLAGDVGAFFYHAAGLNPFAVIGGTQLVDYVGAAEMDLYPRIINVAAFYNDRVDVFSVDNVTWPSLPSGGTGSGGTYTVLFMS